SWVTDKSRGIPVLPGEYTAILSYGKEQDSVRIEVISDPRFDFDPKIDQELYKAQKELNGIRIKLVGDLDALSQCKEELKAIIAFRSDSKDSTLSDQANDMITKIDQLRYQALGKPVEKQVGAWQTFEVTPVKQIRAAERKFMSSHAKPSDQEYALITEAESAVIKFNEKTRSFMNDTYQPFMERVE
ncbi:MAG: hypothetical protein HRT61_25125, partial [Ekhidna sp.]|nr:hypothetical protein [Ekhidna sp.]